MKKLLLILLCLPLIGFAQGWEKTFGDFWDEGGSSVQQTSDGGYIVTGKTNSFDANGVHDVWLIKIDGNGVEQWNQTFGGTGYDGGCSVQQTSDSGYIICGYITSLIDTTYDVYLVKTDENGDSLWTQTFGGPNLDQGFSVQQTTDGGYIVTGRTNSFGNGYTDVWLIKTDGNGVEQWNQTFGGPGYDGGNSVQQTSDGGYVILGKDYSFGNNGQSDVYLIKTDSNGIEQWNQTYGGLLEDGGSNVQQTTDGGYIIIGSAKSFGNGEYDFYLIKTDGNGVEQWNQTFGGTEYDLGTSVQQTTDGGYIVTGMTRDSTYNEDVWLIKTDGNGVEQWNQTFSSDSLRASGACVQQTLDGGFIITGWIQADPAWIGVGDMYLIKTDSQGNITSTFNISAPLFNRKIEKIVDILGRDINPEKNKPFIEIYNDGTVEKKIIIE